MFAPHRREGGDQPRHRPLLRRADPELDALGGSGPEGQGLPARYVARDAVAEAGAQRGLHDLATHVRDFSVKGQDRERGEPRLLPAFAEDGGASTSRPSPTSLTCAPAADADIASIEEDPAQQATPDCDTASYAPDGEEQRTHRRCAARTPSTGATTRRHFNAPEGSLRVDGSEGRRWSASRRFRTAMVGSLHRDSLRVVLDPVFNHAASGEEREVRSGPGGSRLLPPAQRVWCRGDLDLLLKHRDRAPDVPEGSWSTRSCCGRATTR